MSKTEIIVGKEPAPKYLVKDWKDGWKWMTTYAFALIIFITTVPVPEETLALLPDDMRTKLLGVIAILGLLMRFVKQSALLPTTTK